MPHRHAVILLFAIAVAVVGGTVAGWLWGEAMLSVKWLGTLFLNALKMTIVPLVVAAVVSGVTSMGDVRRLGRIGGYTVGYYAATTAVAVLTGLVVVNLVRPGVGLGALSVANPQDVVWKTAGVEDILLSIVSPSLVGAAAEMQILPLITFSLVLGAALTTIGEVGRPVVAFFHGLNEAVMRVVVWLMYLAPLGIFALVAARLGAAGGGAAFFETLAAVGWHVVTVLTGLAIHFLFLTLVLFLLAGRGRDYLVGTLRALLTAFGTASSSATLPLTMECARENGVDPRAVRFVIPLGATVNMDGTALYEAAAAMFIAQAYGFDLGLAQQSIIFVTATLAAIGAAGIPEAGLVTMVIVLSAVGLPLEGMGLLLAVDWFLDRFRTTVNVWGDSVGAAIIHRMLPDRAAML